MVVVHLVLIFSFLHGADDHDRADGNHAWAGGAAFTAFEGRCSDGRNRDDSGVAMQFIPVLGEEAETIRMAQTARGLGLKAKS